MSDMQFDTGTNEFGRPPVQQGSDIAGKLVAWGLASDRQTATYILMGIGAVAVIAMFFLLTGGGSDAPPPPPVNV